MNNIRTRRIIIAVLLCIVTAGIVLAETGVTEEAELAVARFINPNGNLNSIMRFFTNIGEAYGVIGLTAVLLLLPPTRRKLGAPLAVIITSSWLMNTIIKNIIRRARPVERLISQSGYSFPSGHAMNNMALYLSIILLSLSLCKTKAQKTVLIIVCSVLPLIIGISRIYFNVHFLSDVICGWSLGAVVAIAGCSIYFNIRQPLKTPA